jgi:hypothetical protein
MHANNNSMVGYVPDSQRCRLLKRQLSNRSIRSKFENEMQDFASWVARDPGGITGWWYGPIGQGFWQDFEDLAKPEGAQDD